MLVLVLALIVFGPAKLPELMASLGQAIREFQRASRELTEVFQETQQEFQSALDFEEAASQAEPEPQPVAYQVPAEETSLTPVETIAAPAQPEELETAAAMLDPIEPFPVPTPPTAAPETVAAADEAPKPKRARRRKAEIASEPAAEPVAAFAPTAEAAEPPLEVTTTAPALETTTGPALDSAATEPTANGLEPYQVPAESGPNGAVAAPTTRRRRRAAVPTPAPEESP